MADELDDFVPKAWVKAVQDEYTIHLQTGTLYQLPELSQPALPQGALKSYFKKTRAIDEYERMAGEDRGYKLAAHHMSVRGEDAIAITLDLGDGGVDVELFTSNGKKIAAGMWEGGKMRWSKVKV